jgi:hypothetical protein
MWMRLVPEGRHGRQDNGLLPHAHTFEEMGLFYLAWKKGLCIYDYVKHF